MGGPPPHRVHEASWRCARRLFLDATIASAFVARWCAADRIEVVDGVYRVGDDEPKSRVGAACTSRPDRRECSSPRTKLNQGGAPLCGRIERGPPMLAMHVRTPPELYLRTSAAAGTGCQTPAMRSTGRAGRASDASREILRSRLRGV
jgi:hypothetical protein